VSIGNVLVHENSNSKRTLVVRVVNSGSLSVNELTLTFHQDRIFGPVMEELTISDPIPPGSFRDISWEWNLPPTGKPSLTVYTIADEKNNIAEFDESNNSRCVTVTTSRSKSPAGLN